MVGWRVSAELGVELRRLEISARSGRLNLEDLASGRVLQSRPGLTAFPLRPALEVFLECVELLAREGQPGPYHLYDPCCGGAYMLTGIGFLGGEHLRRLSGSDVSPEAIEVARANLALLTAAGLLAREATLRTLIASNGKASHRAALEGLERLRALRRLKGTDPIICAFLGDATRAADVQGGLGADPVDIVMTDVPYGDKSAWRGSALVGAKNPVGVLFEAILPVTRAKSVIALMTLKETRVAHPSFRLVRRLRPGRRSMSILSRD